MPRRCFSIGPRCHKGGTSTISTRKGVTLFHCTALNRLQRQCNRKAPNLSEIETVNETVDFAPRIPPRRPGRPSRSVHRIVSGRIQPRGKSGDSSLQSFHAMQILTTFCINSSGTNTTLTTRTQRHDFYQLSKLAYRLHCGGLRRLSGG